ncbi:hypothetical protein BCR35DRAFT_336546 [Leucosporidium creatinivorum]|uniref:Mediator complex subunit 20 n=1 Tax=Leucosporidium creatinivorum TaxID=106004 RepID=A0A1Y2BWZ3_9BASI|nr:hypothetical protein BCR35DRAFT_336546 [Leucosporidium creatinivorum]
MVFVEDTSAPSRAVKLQEAKGKGKQKEEDTTEMEGHSRWTFCTLGVATLAAPLATPFDAFLQRVLLGGNQQAINANNPGQWIPRSTAISLEGFIFHIGGDWEVKLGSVMVKGGSAGGSSKGVLIEATYLPVPHLPPSSPFIRNFMTTLFPPQAIANGEVEWIQPDFEGMYEAGINQRPAEGEQEGEWEWTEKHSAWTYVQLFKKESLL